MTEDKRLRQLTELLRRTGTAHHQAFIASDGDDPEWPLWYAQTMQEEFNRLLPAEITISELVYAIVAAERARPGNPAGDNWAEFYARRLLTEYG